MLLLFTFTYTISFIRLNVLLSQYYIAFFLIYSLFLYGAAVRAL